MCHRFLQHSGGDALPQRQEQRQKDSQLSHLKSTSRFGRNPAFLPTVSTSLELRIKTYYGLLYIVLQKGKKDFNLKPNPIVDLMVKWHKLLTFSWSPISSKLV